MVKLNSTKNNARHGGIIVKIKFLGKSGNSNTSGGGRRRSPHYDNLEYLDNNPALKANIENAIRPYFNTFFYTNPYLNSGKVSIEVCIALNIPDDQFHHGLVGSLIYDKFIKVNPATYGLSLNTELIASKGEDQHYVDYFLPH